MTGTTDKIERELNEQARKPETLPNGKVRIFISYAHSDKDIAQALYEELIAVDRTRVECFLDTAAIESGRDFEKEINKALDDADWLVCIYTGEQSDYCGYEIGIFKKTRQISSASDDARLVCLHDVEKLPGVFRNHQNRAIVPPRIAQYWHELR